MSGIDILVIDDQYGSSEAFRKGFCELVGAVSNKGTAISGYPYCFTFHSGQDSNKKNSLKAVEEKIRERWSDKDGTRWALVLLDVRFDQKTKGQNDENFGFELLNHLRNTFGKDLPVVMLTSEDEAKRKRANYATANGYLPKDNLSLETLVSCVTNYGLISDMRNGQYRLIGRSLSLLKILRQARQYAINQLGSRIIYGETGSGKTELARYIHNISGRTGEFKPWTAVEHGDPTMTEDALFGHWKGAFTGAESHQAGEIESAHKGTFLLDEIADLPQKAQQLLIKVRRRDDKGLRTIKRLGHFPVKDSKGEARESVKGILQTNHEIKVNILFLTATNKALYDESFRKNIGFKEDLYADLGLPIFFPSLNERREDVPDIFKWYIEQCGVKKVTVSDQVLDFLKKRDWKNQNIVGLKKFAEAAVSNVGDFDEILMHHLPEEVSNDKEIRNEAGPAPASKPEQETRTQTIRVPEPPKTSLKPPSAGPVEAPAVEIKESKSNITLQNLADILNTLPIDKDDPAIKGAKPRLEEAFQNLMKHLLGAALAGCKGRSTGPYTLKDAVVLIEDDPSITTSDPKRIVNKILGRIGKEEITETDLEELVNQWKASL